MKSSGGFSTNLHYIMELGHYAATPGVPCRRGPPFLNAWTEPKVRGWYEGRVSGRMFRRIWPSFHIFFSLHSPAPLHLSFLLPSLPLSILLTSTSFISCFCVTSLTDLSSWKISPHKSCFSLSLSVSISLPGSHRTLGQRWARQWTRRGSQCWTSSGWGRY